MASATIKMVGKAEKRWALLATYRGIGGADRFLIGRFSWPDGSEDDVNVRTFRTRKLAREAKQMLTSYRREARPVKVLVTTTIIES